MKISSGIGIISTECEITEEMMDGSFSYKWFNCNIEYLENTLCFQDFIHIILFIQSVEYSEHQQSYRSFGNGTVSKTLLKYLIDTVSKDKHGLTATDIDPQDRQN